MKKFIFDIDGTLTLSRQQIDTSFEAYMIVFCCKYPVYLVTGSDRQKTIDQIGLDICFRAEKVYNCSGADAIREIRMCIDLVGRHRRKWKNFYKMN